MKREFWHCENHAIIPESQVTKAIGQMMLFDGFFHADTHPGNIMLLSSGKAALIDFGQCAELDPAQVITISKPRKYSRQGTDTARIITHTAHRSGQARPIPGHAARQSVGACAAKRRHGSRVWQWCLHTTEHCLVVFVF